MIVKGARATKLLVTLIAIDHLRLIVLVHHLINFILKMNPQTMNYAISLRQGRELTVIKRTLELLIATG